jgi:hypothetical protein
VPRIYVLSAEERFGVRGLALRAFFHRSPQECSRLPWGSADAIQGRPPSATTTETFVCDAYTKMIRARAWRNDT